MALRAPDTTVGPYRERDSLVLSATIRDHLLAAIPGASLDTLTLTVYSEHDPDTLIRDHEDIKSEVTAGGVLTHTFTSGDTTIVDVDELTESHRALFEWTYNVDKRGSWEVRIILRNVYHVAAP